MVFPAPPRPTTTLVRREVSAVALARDFSPEQLLSCPLNPLEVDYEPEESLPQPYSDPTYQSVPYVDRPKIPKPPGDVARLKRGGYNLEQQLAWTHSLYTEVMVRGPMFSRTQVQRTDGNAEKGAGTGRCQYGPGFVWQATTREDTGRVSYRKHIF